MLKMLFSALVTLAVLYALFKILTARADLTTRLIWAAVVFFLPIIGLIAWVAMGGPGAPKI